MYARTGLAIGVIETDVPRPQIDAQLKKKRNAMKHLSERYSNKDFDKDKVGAHGHTCVCVCVQL